MQDAGPLEPRADVAADLKTSHVTLVPGGRSETVTRWSSLRKLGFPFVFAWSVLWYAPFPIDAIPKLGEWVYEKWTAGQDALVRAFGHLVLGADASLVTGSTGSDGELLTLEGERDGKKRTIRLRRYHAALLERGFHWIQSEPFNR